MFGRIASVRRSRARRQFRPLRLEGLDRREVLSGGQFCLPPEPVPADGPSTLDMVPTEMSQLQAIEIEMPETIPVQPLPRPDVRPRVIAVHKGRHPLLVPQRNGVDRGEVLRIPVNDPLGLGEILLREVRRLALEAQLPAARGHDP